MTEIVITGAGAVYGGADDWFDPIPLLGKRGWKYLTPATRYLLGAAVLTVADAGLDPLTHDPESMGVVVGTNFAAAPVVARIDEIVQADTADMLSPVEAPNFSVNIPASNISMKYAMRAFNLTLTNPVVAGLESVLLLTSSIRKGRARLGIAGATEENPKDEGACCLMLETAEDAAARGAKVRAVIDGGFCRFESPVGQVDDLHTVSPLLRLIELIEGPGEGVVVARSPHGHVAELRIKRSSS